MPRPNFRFLPIVALACAAAACASSPPVPPDEIPDAPVLAVPGFAVVAPGVAISGQPDLERFRAARELGYVTIVNLKTLEEGAHYEEFMAGQVGFVYEHIPVDGMDDLDTDHAEDLADLLEPGTGRPLLLHCGSGARAAGVWALYLVHERGATPQAALDELESHGVLDPELRAALERRMAE